jgi:hypothetical protein
VTKSCSSLKAMVSQLSLSLNQILAHDAPVLSPVSPSMPDFQWDIPFYAHSPPSPPASSPASSPPRMLKSRTSPDPPPDACVPTHQLFDLDAPPSPAPSLLSSDSLSSELPPSNKRSASPSPALTKKPRAQGERISSKDFIPPDVTGLTKREARLVKNRAAAFLSRQRKREEFETMEQYVPPTPTLHSLTYFQPRCRAGERECTPPRTSSNAGRQQPARLRGGAAQG